MRLFLAIDLPVRVRGSLREAEAGLRESCPGWRWVRPEGIHLTLRFLGEVGADRDASARDAWRRVAEAHPPVRLRVGGLGVFPGSGRPRVLWAGVEEIFPGGALVSLASALEGAARSLGFEPEERPFRAHLTLARAARDGRAPGRPEGSALVASELLADEVLLFRSELGPGGARYSQIEGFSLGGGR